MIKNSGADDLIKSLTASILTQAASSLMKQSMTVRSAPKTINDKKNDSIQPKIEIRVDEASTTTTQNNAIQSEKTEADAFRKGLEDCLDNDFFEPGIKSATDHYVEKWLTTNALMTQVETGKVFLANRGNDRRIMGILNVVSHMDMKTFHPMNEMIAIGALSHRSTEIKECAIRAFEYWENIDLIRSLKHHTLTPKWLDDYRREVISDFCGEE